MILREVLPVQPLSLGMIRIVKRKRRIDTIFCDWVGIQGVDGVLKTEGDMSQVL